MTPTSSKELQELTPAGCGGPPARSPRLRAAPGTHASRTRRYACAWNSWSFVFLASLDFFFRIYHDFTRMYQDFTRKSGLPKTSYDLLGPPRTS